MDNHIKKNTPFPGSCSYEPYLSDSTLTGSYYSGRNFQTTSDGIGTPDYNRSLCFQSGGQEKKPMIPLVLMILMVCLTTCSQYLIKSALNSRKKFRLLSKIEVILFSTSSVLLGALIMAGAPLLYIKAICFEGLTGIYGLNGLSYLMVFMVSVFLLKERTGPYHIAGIIMITTGVVLWNLA